MQEAQNIECEIFLGTCRVYMHNLLQTFFGYFFYIPFALFIALNEENSKHSQISTIPINCQGVSSALEKTFQRPALFKEFKDTHKP